MVAEKGAAWKSIIYAPLLTTSAFLSQMLGPDRSCRAAVKRIAAWLTSGAETRRRRRRPVIEARQRCRKQVPLRLMKRMVSAVVSGSGRLAMVRSDGQVGRSFHGEHADTSARSGGYPQSRSQAPGLAFHWRGWSSFSAWRRGCVGSAIGLPVAENRGNALFRSLWDRLDPATSSWLIIVIFLF